MRKMMAMLLAAMCLATANAQPWPSRTIRIFDLNRAASLANAAAGRTWSPFRLRIVT